MKRNDIVGGLGLIVLGLLFLAANFGVLPPWEIGRLWPLILIVIGVGQLLFPDADGRLGGLPLLLVGGIFLAHNYDVMRLKQSWPLFIVAGGISIIVASRCDSAAQGGK